MKQILHLVWIQGEEDLPAEFRRNIDDWNRVLRNWKIVIWDHRKASEQWVDYAVFEDRCFHHATRADLILARALRDFGGLATGTDCRPNKPEGLLNFIACCSSMLVLTPNRDEISNGLVWSANPGHPFFEKVCEYQLRNEGKELESNEVPKATGPRCYYNVWRSSYWKVYCVSSAIAYTHHWSNRSERNDQAWIDPGYAASWYGG